MLIMLQKYVAFKTISKNPQLYLEESRHCAQFYVNYSIILVLIKQNYP